MLQTYIVRGWPQNKDKLEPTQQGYWPIRYELAINDGVRMKGKQTIMPFSLQVQILD